MTLDTTIKRLEVLEFADRLASSPDVNFVKEAVTMPPAIPIEQLKGDISRAGHPVQRLMALDPDSRRLFFTDVQGNFMYAEFSDSDDAYRVTKVGFQTEIAREYGAALSKAFDAVDLEAEPRDAVTTAHEEGEANYLEPGVLPSGTPGDRPDDEDGDGFGDEPTVTRDPVGDIRDRHEKNSGWNAESHEEQMKKELSDAVALGELKLLFKLGSSSPELIVQSDDVPDAENREDKSLSKQGPPRPGLVPESGDPEHPYRWIRDPGAAGGPKKKPSPEVQRGVDSYNGKGFYDAPDMESARAVASHLQSTGADASVVPLGNGQARVKSGDKKVRPEATPEWQAVKDAVGSKLGQSGLGLMEMATEKFGLSPEQATAIVVSAEKYADQPGSSEIPIADLAQALQEYHLEWKAGRD